jgi:hypothetical protein
VVFKLVLRLDLVVLKLDPVVFRLDAVVFKPDPLELKLEDDEGARDQADPRIGEMPRQFS